MRFARQLVALRRFLADRQQPDARRLDAERDMVLPGDRRGDRGTQDIVRIVRIGAGEIFGEVAQAVPVHIRVIAVGNAAASAGRSTPRSIPNAACVAITVAPV